MGWGRGEEMCLWWGSQPRWHNKVRSTTLLLDPQISPFLWPSLLLSSLSSLPPGLWTQLVEVFFLGSAAESFTAVLIIFQLQTPTVYHSFISTLLSNFIPSLCISFSPSDGSQAETSVAPRRNAALHSECHLEISVCWCIVSPYWCFCCCFSIKYENGDNRCNY